MENLNIIYFLETTTICGGVKVVFEQARELISRNINTKVASFFPYPYWIYFKVPFIQISSLEELCNRNKNVLFILTYFIQITFKICL